MGPALLTTRSALLGNHALIGCSTGFMTEDREDWPKLVKRSASVSSLAVELSAISEPELSGLLSYLHGAPQLPFGYVSVHAPSKGRELSEPDLVARLTELPPWIDALVLHPDTIEDPAPYRALGRRLVLENMDQRKSAGRDDLELESYFADLPDAGLCFDIAHAKSVDDTMTVGHSILRRFGNRLRHVHLSSLDSDSHHVPLSIEDQELFWPLLSSCRDVPWILEAPPPSW
jgi:hypothetical protein